MNEKIEKALVKIKKIIKDSQATYFWGVEYSSDAGPDWRARIIPSKAGVTPFLAGARTKEGLLKELELFLENKDIKEIVIQYCNSQISIHEEAIKFNRDLIKDYENLPS